MTQLPLRSTKNGAHSTNKYTRRPQTSTCSQGWPNSTRNYITREAIQRHELKHKPETLCDLVDRVGGLQGSLALAAHSSAHRRSQITHQRSSQTAKCCAISSEWSLFGVLLSGIGGPFHAPIFLRASLNRLLPEVHQRKLAASRHFIAPCLKPHRVHDCIQFLVSLDVRWQAST